MFQYYKKILGLSLISLAAPVLYQYEQAGYFCLSESLFSSSSSGHCLHEIFALREGRIGRVPDMVVWPSE